MKEKTEQKFYLLVKAFVLLGAVGLIVFVLSNLHSTPQEVAFSLIAFIISVAAVIMTTLQSISISQQIKITKKASDIVDETAEQVRKLIATDSRMEKEIREDLALDHEIVAALEEIGIGDDENERREVARRISTKINRSRN
ncbi:MAG: hypothetical protein M3Q79_01655 [bacterium]|nr:hypothetical protein [bacterium]